MITNPFTGEFILNANPKGCNQYSGPKCSHDPTKGFGGVKPKDRIWHWTDTREETPTTSLDKVASKRPLAVVRDGDYVKWVADAIDEQNEPDTVQRAGTMFIQHVPTGKTVKSGYFMDFPEEESEKEYERYSKLSKKDRALEELKRQVKYGLGKDYKFHKKRQKVYNVGGA